LQVTTKLQKHVVPAFFRVRINSAPTTGRSRDRERLASERDALSQSAANAQNGVGALQVSDGGLAQVTTL